MPKSLVSLRKYAALGTDEYKRRFMMLLLMPYDVIFLLIGYILSAVAAPDS
jgi:hypothetical protein